MPEGVPEGAGARGTPETDCRAVDRAPRLNFEVVGLAEVFQKPNPVRFFSALRCLELIAQAVQVVVVYIWGQVREAQPSLLMPCRMPSAKHCRRPVAFSLEIRIKMNLYIFRDFAYI